MTNCHTTDGKIGTPTDTINGIAVSHFEVNGTFCFDASATSSYKTTPVTYSIVINTTDGIAISGIVYDYREENGQQPEYNVVYTIADGTESFQGVVEANQTQYAQIRTLLNGLVADSSDHSEHEDAHPHHHHESTNPHTTQKSDNHDSHDHLHHESENLHDFQSRWA